jgi:hypothetical protein
MPSNSQVPKVVLNQDDTISIEVNVYGFDAGMPVELTGQATQANGAIASFYSVQAMPEHDGDSGTIWVKSIPLAASKKFDAGFPITVVVRASEAWVTTLETAPDSGSHPSTGPGGPAAKGAWESNDNYSWAVAPPWSPPQPSAPASAAAAPAPDAQLRHGKWWDLVKGDPLAAVMGGRFTRLFPDLPGARFDRRPGRIRRRTPAYRRPTPISGSSSTMTLPSIPFPTCVRA